MPGQHQTGGGGDAHHQGDCHGHLHGHANTVLIAASSGVTHPNGGGQGETQRHHKNQGGEVERDLVAGDDLGPQAADEKGNDRKDTYLKEN